MPSLWRAVPAGEFLRGLFSPSVPRTLRLLHGAIRQRAGLLQAVRAPPGGCGLRGVRHLQPIRLLPQSRLRRRAHSPGSSGAEPVGAGPGGGRGVRELDEIGVLLAGLEGAAAGRGRAGARRGDRSGRDVRASAVAAVPPRPRLAAVSIAGPASRHSAPPPPVRRAPGTRRGSAPWPSRPRRTR
jgi:hypothetical protein